MREVFRAREEPQESAALLGCVIADGATQHRVARFKRIEYRALRYRSFNIERNLSINICQRTQVWGNLNSNHQAILLSLTKFINARGRTHTVGVGPPNQ